MASPAPASPARKRTPKLDAQKSRAVYLLAIEKPADVSATAWYTEVGSQYGVSASMVAHIAKGQAWSETTADLRSSGAPAADADPAPLARTEEDRPVAEPAAPAPDGRVIEAAGTARLPRLSPFAERAIEAVSLEEAPDGATLARTATLLNDMSELLPTLLRAIRRGRPLPSYLSETNIEEMALQAGELSDHLAGRTA